MDVKKGVIVSLGYGKYFLSDKIVGMTPIEENRGPARRTHVYIDGLADPVVASKTEATILREMSVEGPGQVECAMALDLLERTLTEFGHVGRMLRRSIKDEVGLDIDDIEKRIKDVLTHDAPAPVQESLFSREDSD
ncbi:MAG: hypothetical protein CVT63_00530 [Candidatus Anoxymicrobium japonicum]|uniref:Uncharacterized protein n=1 Tax=Candidatus Anoxymicrobium japonicum TaxID=2013648 RepID=A0A2N3G843_9ACTN|nr:MAG: hypothetical protein CVT63_00530 [Candidatus Anoxymicrobium japonicum]